MQNNVRKKALIFENGDEDYIDIISCLPKDIVSVLWERSKDTSVINTFGKNDYCLCICDLTKLEPTLNGIPLVSDIVLNDLSESIQHIAMLCRHLACSHYIIVTKLPVRILRDHFKKIKNASDMEAIFDKDYSNLYRKLNASKSLPFGIVYASEKVHIVIKPYYANKKDDLKRDITDWKENFKKILSTMCCSD